MSGGGTRQPRLDNGTIVCFVFYRKTQPQLIVFLETRGSEQRRQRRLRSRTASTTMREPTAISSTSLATRMYW